MVDILLFYAIVAAVFTFGKQALSNGAPFFLCALRLIPAGLIFLTGVYFFDRKHFFIKKDALKSLLGLIVFVFFMDVFRFVGLSYVPSSYSALLSTLSPFVAALFAWHLYQESLTLQKILALVLGACAVLPLVVSNLTHAAAGSRAIIAIGYGALFISTTSVVIRTFFLKDLIDIKKYNTYFILGITFLSAGLLSLCCSLCVESWNPIPCDNLTMVVPYILLLMFIYNIFAQPLYAALVKKYSITLITFFMFSTPLITAFLNKVLYGQQIPTIFVFSCFMLSGAFVLFYRSS